MIRNNTKVYRACREMKERGYYADEAGTIYDPDGVPVRLYKLTERHEYLRFRYYDYKGRDGLNIIVEAHRFLGYLKFGDDAFVPGQVVRHLNDNKLDNSLKNLILGDEKQNYHDTPIEKRIAALEKGKKCPKLTEEDLAELRQLAKSMKQVDLAKRYGRPVRTIRRWVNKDKHKTLSVSTDLTLLFQE